MKQSKIYRTIERKDKRTKRQNNNKLEDGVDMLNFDRYIWHTVILEYFNMKALSNFDFQFF